MAYRALASSCEKGSNPSLSAASVKRAAGHHVLCTRVQLRARTSALWRAVVGVLPDIRSMAGR